MSQGAERERARVEEDKRKEQVLFAQLVVSQSSDDLSKTAIIFVSLYICDLIIVVLRKFHRFWRLWKNLKRGRKSVVRHTNWCALSFNQEHHQLSPENSNLNQRRLTDAPLPRTIIHWFPLETI